MAFAREQICGHIVSPATREHAMMEETFSVRFLSGLYNEEMRVAVVRSEMLVAEARDSLGTQRKKNVHHWKPLSSNG
jgi:hypothetical protein